MKNRSDNAQRERMIFKAIQSELVKIHGPEKAKTFLVSPSYLRAEQGLANNKAKYNFDLKRVANEVVTEQKLDRNDLFVISRLGVFLTKQFAATPGKEVLQSYPNAVEFPPTAGLAPADLETIYNGFLQLKIANRVNIENLSMHEFKYAPDTQQASATTKSSFNLDDACYKPAPLIYLHGTMDINLTIEFPTFAGIQLTPTDFAANGVVKLVVVPFGFLVKGAASLK